MSTRVQGTRTSGAGSSIVARWRRDAWVVILIADAGLLLWGALAALIPTRLTGPGGAAILPAGYQGYAGGSWEQLKATSPEAAGYILLLFRIYGIYIVAFSILAIAIAANAFDVGNAGPGGPC